MIMNNQNVEELRKEHIANLLRRGIVNVLFLKKDGSKRNMVCTLKEEFIPTEKHPKGSNKVENEEVVAVFDTEKNDWRSFRYDSVIQYYLIKF